MKTMMRIFKTSLELKRSIKKDDPRLQNNGIYVCPRKLVWLDL